MQRLEVSGAVRPICGSLSVKGLIIHLHEAVHCICIASSTLIVLAASQRRRMINTVCCIYSKLPPEDR